MFIRQSFFITAEINGTNFMVISYIAKRCIKMSEFVEYESQQGKVTDSKTAEGIHMNNHSIYDNFTLLYCDWLRNYS